MKLLKPSWVTHNGKPIFAIDIHPDGSRFATGGQGEESGTIIIWNMSPVQDETAENNDSIPKVLCHMDNHLGCVNCVRWSNSGYYLASGSDDRLVMIWQKVSGTGTAFGSGKTNVEQWRCSHTLRSHSGDVLDVAWSPHDAWLASCSIDNTIVIWNACKFPEVISVLRGHSGLVKGVSWDPIGKYISSQADDKSLRIWRTLDWKEETAIFKPFHECGGTTHILRLSWSPDGSYLVSAHAMNNRGPTAQIIEREGWSTNMDFVGHRKAVTCVRFSTNIYTKPTKKGSKKSQNYTMCAIGSRDKSVSVWMTALKRPLVVIHDLFSNSVMDISWSHTGNEMMACSWDGSVCYFHFSKEEIGPCLSKEDSRRLLEKMYGKGVIAANSQSASLANTIIGNVAILKLQEQQQKKVEELAKVQQKAVTFTPKKIIPQMADGKPVDVKSQQIETRTPDGRRRITPLYIAPQAFEDGPPAPFNGGSNHFQESEAFKSSVVVKQEQIDEEEAEVAGKRASEADTLMPKSALDSRLTDKTKLQTEKEKTALRQSKMSLSGKRKDASASQQTKKPRKEYTRRVTLQTTPTVLPMLPAERVHVPSRPSSSSQVNVPSPPSRKTFSVSFTISEDREDETISIEIENDQVFAGITIHKVKCTNEGEVMWETFLSSKALLAAGTKDVICITCDDRTLHCFSYLGRRLLPQFLLPAMASSLECNSHYVMVITTNGRLYVWDMKQCTAILKEVSLVPIMGGPNKQSLTSATLTAQGVAVLVLSGGKAYTYSPSMVSWMVLDTTDNLLRQCSDHANSVPAESVNYLDYPLMELQKSSQNSAKNIFASYPSLQKQSTLGHLENQISAALTIKSASEYKFWMLTYIRFLVQEVQEQGLRDVCEDLLGPVPRQQDEDLHWQPSVLGLSKCSLLEEILPIIGSNLKLQRLFTEFQEQLDMINR